MAHNRSILDTTATLDLVTFIEATYDHLFATGSNISTDLKRRTYKNLGNIKKRIQKYIQNNIYIPQEGRPIISTNCINFAI